MWGPDLYSSCHQEVTVISGLAMSQGIRPGHANPSHYPDVGLAV